MSWSAVIIGGGALLGGIISSQGSGDAADAASRGSREAIEEQRRQFNLMLQLLAPGQQFGEQAINELSRLFGFDTAPQETNELLTGTTPFGGTFTSETHPELFPAGTGPDMRGEEAIGQPTGLDVFRESPDFRFRQEEGLEGIAQTLGAGGAGAFSGNALRELNRFNSSLASGEFNDFVNRRLAAANLGQVASSQAGQGALTTGLSIGNALQNQANARASGILGQTAANQGLVRDLTEALLLLQQGSSTTNVPTLGRGGPPI